MRDALVCSFAPCGKEEEIYFLFFFGVRAPLYIVCVISSFFSFSVGFFCLFLFFFILPLFS
jgi:hypothetical protein